MGVLKSNRSPYYPGAVNQDQKSTGITAGRFDEQRAQEAFQPALIVRSSVAGREVIHHFAWIKYFTFWRTDGLAQRAGYAYSHLPKIINSGPTGINRNRIRPQMSSYPKPSSQGGMSTPPRFGKANQIKQNLYRPPTY